MFNNPLYRICQELLPALHQSNHLANTSFGATNGRSDGGKRCPALPCRPGLNASPKVEHPTSQSRRRGTQLCFSTTKHSLHHKTQEVELKSRQSRNIHRGKEQTGWGCGRLAWRSLWAAALESCSALDERKLSRGLVCQNICCVA